MRTPGGRRAAAIAPIVTTTATATGTITSTATTLDADTVALLDRSVPAGRVGALWMSIGRSPSIEEVRAAADRYRVIVLNAWDTAQLREIKSVNPDAIVLVYKCLSSTRSYEWAVIDGRDADRLPTGVGYVQASSQPSWFATDTTGRRIEWRPYPEHWQMAAWDPGYQAAWVRAVTDEIVEEGWDGVSADNALGHLSGYSDQLLAGTSSAEETNEKLRAGLDALVSAAGVELNGAGKLLIPNLTDGRLGLARWQGASRYGGTMEEAFTHWGTGADAGHLYDWGATGWIDQTAELAAPLTLAVTHVAEGDERTMRYAYASALVRAQGRVAWTAVVDTNYVLPEGFAWQDIELGAPAGPGARTPSGAWARSFERGFVAVNPAETPAQVDIPSGFGTASVTIGPLDAVPLRR